MHRFVFASLRNCLFSMRHSALFPEPLRPIPRVFTLALIRS
jgi:hypothetical protein